ncbi:type II toxin-antitoxin system VapC family toxin [Candidatus Woesearchaeota archaeon]|nr:type II toxin-antitoxin system VapC family toxin [Candidatus Woesearchaeota archaeon]
MTYYIDSTVFFLAFTNADAIGAQARDVLDSIVKGKITATTSYVTFDELFWELKRKTTREHVIEYTKHFLHIPKLTLVPLDREVTLTAHKLLTTYPLDPRDALHAASAIVSGASHIISEDSDFGTLKEIGWKRINAIGRSVGLDIL